MMNNYFRKELSFKVGEDITDSMYKAIDLGNLKDPGLWKPKKAVIKEIVNEEDKLTVFVEVEIPLKEAKTIGGSCKIDAVLSWLVSRLHENEVYFRTLEEIDENHTLATTVFSNAVLSLDDIADYSNEFGLVTTYEVYWPSFTGYEADFIVYGANGMVFHSDMYRDTRSWNDWRLIKVSTDKLNKVEREYIYNEYRTFNFKNKRVCKKTRE